MSYKNRRFRFSEVYIPDGFHEKDWQKLESEYTKMIEIASSARAQIVFVHIPMGINDDSYSYPPLRMSKFSSENGVPFIDVLPALKEASRHETLYWEKDGHCNSAGYRVIAETMYSKLIEEGIVP